MNYSWRMSYCACGPGDGSWFQSSRSKYLVPCHDGKSQVVGRCLALLRITILVPREPFVNSATPRRRAKLPPMLVVMKDSLPVQEIGKVTARDDVSVMEQDHVDAYGFTISVIGREGCETSVFGFGFALASLL